MFVEPLLASGIKCQVLVVKLPHCDILCKYPAWPVATALARTLLSAKIKVPPLNPMKKFFVQNDFNYFQGVKLSFPPSQTIKRNDLSSIVGQSCHGLTASAQLFYFLKLVLIYLLDKQKQECYRTKVPIINFSKNICLKKLPIIRTLF